MDESDEGVVGSRAPRALIVTLYGLYGRERGGWMSIADLVALMSDLGVDQQAVRSSIFRLKKRGLLEAEKVGRAAGYRLSPDAEAILAEGDTRIFQRTRAAVGDGWLLVVFSVPEAERDKRHTLRTTLTRLGLGTVGPGTWVAPAHLEPAVVGALERVGLRGFADLFVGAHRGAESASETVAAWWDLRAMEKLYAEWLDRFAPVRARWRSGEGDTGDAQAFVDWVGIVTAWRRLPYLDPGLPLESLPPDWTGVRAEDLVMELRELLAPLARRHVDRVVAP
ncbi:PaaX family transcriptional regulator C-terminal domain-containing protein [Actinomycetospora lutea]|uniref:PaaX family transcriptional regulator n=1 Tax=Actinomycetospora lutea TaxID=663604 RepID=UPI0023655422|nr:PaaX family transcriptional regulator C-terminal domain-containing protein [Actinomycetospora lutea]MDD7939105.1 PaaX family transcriptional regulator C-terminal domain-containing protein [Actinomycetospora lutea]